MWNASGHTKPISIMGDQAHGTLIGSPTSSTLLGNDQTRQRLCVTLYTVYRYPQMVRTGPQPITRSPIMGACTSDRPHCDCAQRISPVLLMKVPQVAGLG